MTDWIVFDALASSSRRCSRRIPSVYLGLAVRRVRGPGRPMADIHPFVFVDSLEWTVFMGGRDGVFCIAGPISYSYRRRLSVTVEMLLSVFIAIVNEQERATVEPEAIEAEHDFGEVVQFLDDGRDMSDQQAVAVV